MKIELTNKERNILIHTVNMMMSSLSEAYNKSMNEVFSKERQTLSIILSKLNNR